MINEQGLSLNTSKKNSLKKKEILRSKKHIEYLFSKDTKGIKLNEYPILAINKQINELDYPLKVIFSISKKKLKKAVDRNLVKRRIKEAYRKNKHKLLFNSTLTNKKNAICFVYLANTTLPYNLIEKKIITLLNRLYHENNK